MKSSRLHNMAFMKDDPEWRSSERDGILSFKLMWSRTEDLTRTGVFFFLAHDLWSSKSTPRWPSLACLQLKSRTLSPPPPNSPRSFLFLKGEITVTEGDVVVFANPVLAGKKLSARE